MLSSLDHIYTKVPSKPRVLYYVIGDADDARYIADMTIFGAMEIEYLVCFRNMIKRFYDHGKKVPTAKLALAAADIYDTHFASSKYQFHARKAMSERRWMAYPDIAEFCNYF
ncbi:unnamed protein product [Phytophthora fragariaefolia]|uniref:Unnamed protein product n=1 Tax=Phytophthora fragariaefolia TaxID=1490495 RepID=A0A9W6X317_9STRA|nr:unnamed protein product [Phytophthora fragariaefolia]